jgi:hypothetical protein
VPLAPSDAFPSRSGARQQQLGLGVLGREGGDTGACESIDASRDDDMALGHWVLCNDAPSLVGLERS